MLEETYMVDDLTEEAAKKYLKKLIKELSEDDWVDNLYARNGVKAGVNDAKMYLSFFVENFNKLNNQDYFGTEGWQHRYGFGG